MVKGSIFVSNKETDMELLTYKKLLAVRFETLNDQRAVAECHISRINGDTPEQYADKMHKGICETITLELMN